MTTDDVVAKILDQVRPLAPVDRPLIECGDCVLAVPATAAADMPSCPLASRDGYAVRAADRAAACPAAPVRLVVAGVSAPGDAVPHALPSHSAWRVMTGAPLPPGADAVVRSEESKLLPRERAQGVVEMADPIAAGRFVVQAGSEFSAGKVVLPAGSALGPAELAVLAALGFERVPVVPKARVAIVVTGTELRRSAADAQRAKVHASNGILVASMVQACGGIVESTCIVSDDPAELARAFEAALRSDLIVSTGGTGQGDRDAVKQVLRDREALSMWDAETQGSRPVAFRLLRRSEGEGCVPHVALPGRPIAASMAFSIFVHPLLRHLSAHPRRGQRYLAAHLAAADDGARQSHRFLPVRLSRGPSGWEAAPPAGGSLYGLTAAIGAHGYALLPRAGTGSGIDHRVQVLVAPWHEQDIERMARQEREQGPDT